MALQDEITARQRDVQTDSYAMSIGELMSLYASGEIDIHPEFQRIFRWNNVQKSRLIESILLGIPLPPIFVAQRDDGVWDVIDGLQRLSTIFQFAGILCDEDKQPVAPLTLAATGYDYLPSLRNRTWESEFEEASLTPAQRLYIKRAKLDMKIILKGSDIRSKLDLFLRLNTGGAQLSDQEVRNCLLLMANPDFYRWVQRLSRCQPFVDTLCITDREMDQQYNMELVVRFLVFRTVDEGRLSDIGDLTLFLNHEVIRLAMLPTYDAPREEAAFRWVFDNLSQTTGDNSFRRYRAGDDRFVGGFLVSAFETIAIGLGYHYGNVRERVPPDVIEGQIKELWRRPEYAEGFAAGMRASTRIPRTIPLGREMFSRI